MSSKAENKLKVRRPGDHIAWYMKRLNEFGESFAEDWTEEQNFGSIQLQYIDLTDRLLKKADFRSANLFCADFRNADLREADFRSSNLRCAKFDGANLGGASFLGADVRGTKLVGKHVVQMYKYLEDNKTLDGFKDWVITQENSHNPNFELDLKGVWLRDLDLENVDLVNTNFDLASLEKVNFKNSDLSAACFSNALIDRCEFTQTALAGAKIRNSNISNSNFTSSVLVHSEISECTFSQINFSSANFSGAEIVATTISSCEMKKSNIRHTNFVRVNFNRTDFRGVGLNFGFTDEDRVSQLDQCDFNGSNLQNTIWEEQDLSWNNLTGVDLSGANLKNTNLRNTDFTNSKILNADLTGADLRGTIGLVLDETKIQGAIFDANAADPWSILRASYTGPKFFFYVILTLIYFIPFASKIVYWRAVNSYQSLSADVGILQCGGLECKESNIFFILLGIDQGWIAVATVLIVAYNLFRAYLTASISILRDAEERSGYSPAWKSSKSRYRTTETDIEIYLAGLNSLNPTKGLIHRTFRNVRYRLKFGMKNFLSRFQYKIRNSQLIDAGYSNLYRIHKV